MTTSEQATPSNFIRDIIDHDLKIDKHAGRVTTRFPPEPNGYLHIGHAKSICLNFGISKDYRGRCHLRFDDTNPTKEEVEYTESIIEDVRWLGFDWGEHLYYASDYFEQLYEYALQLVKDGKAYVCDLSAEQIREYRGTLTKPGKNSPYRERSPEENLDLFQRMRAGEFEDGSRVLRAKIDMSAANLNMRDPTIYRIRRAAHHRTGTSWCIYPMYDFTHCLSDSIEDITHSLCTLEFENNRPLYDWFLAELPVKSHPQQIEFARPHALEKIQVFFWRAFAIGAVLARRRGYTPESIRNFCDRIGVAKKDSTVDVILLENAIRDDLNQKAPRVMCVLRPLKVVIENYPEGETEELDAPYFPDDPPRMGFRKVPFSREIFIERADFMEEPFKKFFRLAPDREVRLRWAYIIKCEQVIKDESGEVVELRCSYDPESRSGSASGRKVKGTIHWVSAEQSREVEVRLYDRLFNLENPAGEDLDNALNPDSLTILKNCRAEPSLASASASDRYQFERQGYFFVDPIDSKEGIPVFNRTVPLRDAWAKILKAGKHKR
jgi:glutaminyl-tRNA synthetase